MLTGVLLSVLSAATPLFEPLDYDVVRIDIAALSQPPGTPVTLTLPDGHHHQAVVQGMRVHPNGNRTWSASIADSGWYDGYVLTVTGNEASGLFGTVLTPHGEYRLAPAGDGWRTVSVSAVPAVPDDHGAAEIEPAVQRTSIAAEKAAEPPSEPSSFKVLLLYTDEARAGRSDAQWSAWLDNLMAVTNTAYEQSGIQIEFMLARRERVAATDAGEADAALARLVPTSPAFDAAAFGEVERWRVESGAHFVTLARNTTGSYCGYANILPRCIGSACMDTAVGYSVFSVACPSLVLAHELGHNLGSHHEPGAGPAAQPFAYGHVNAVPVRTVMSVNPAVPRIAKFSSPYLDCNGEPCGVAEVSDNVRSINDARRHIEDWVDKRSVDVAVLDPAVKRGGTAQAHVAMAGLLGGQVDISLWRNGAWVADLHSGPAPSGGLKLSIPADTPVGDGYKLVARATLAPEFTAESAPISVVDPKAAPQPAAPSGGGGGGATGTLLALILSALGLRRFRARRCARAGG